MRTVFAAAAAAVAVLALTGCAATPAAPAPAPAPTVTVTVTAPAPTPTPLPQTERAYRLAMANLECAWVDDDVTFENCTIGAYVLATGEALTDADFTYDNDGLIIFA